MLFWLYFGQYWSYGENKGRFDWAIGYCESIGSSLGVIGMKEVCVMAKITGITGQKSVISVKNRKFRKVKILIGNDM